MRTKLQAFTARLLAIRLLEAASRALLIGLGVLVLWSALSRWQPGLYWSWPAGAAVVAAVLIGAMLAAWLRLPRVEKRARLLDRLAAAKDRFATAVAFQALPAPSPMQSLALAECRRHAAQVQLSRIAPLRLPREVYWLWAPVAALCLLELAGRTEVRTRQAARLAAVEEIAPTARALEEMARKAEAASSEDSALRRAAEEMRAAAKRIRQEALEPEQARLNALRELSELEKIIAAQKQGTQPPATGELADLQKALQTDPTTQAAAEALRQQDLTKAIAELEKAAAELAQREPQQPDASNAQQALREALQKLVENKQRSEAMQALAQQLAGAKGSELLQKLAELLKKAGGQQKGEPSGAPGAPMDAEALQKLLAALEELKLGRPGEGAGQQLALGQTGPIPSGLPGSERDEGTTETPFGKVEEPAPNQTEALALRGTPGEGAASSAALPAGQPSGDAKQPYRQVYEAMAAAAEDAVVREEIPLGSRVLVKRYFEAIRPQ